MATFEKLVRKLVYEPNKVTIDDIRGLLDHFDYTERKKPGSECVFHKKGSYPINVPTIKGRYVKTFYVKRIVKILELEVYLESSEGD